MAKTQAELDVEYAKIAGGYKKEQFESLTASIKSDDKLVTDAYTKLSGATAALKNADIRSIAGYLTSRDAGSKAQRMRSIVEFSKLMVNAPIDFAKAAYLPDEQLIQNILRDVAPSGDTDLRNPNIATRAWQEFYKRVTPGAGNLWGTVREMQAKFGEDTQDLSTDAGLERQRKRVQDQLLTESAQAESFDSRYRALVDTSGAFEKFLAENPQLKPGSDEAYEAFYQDNGMQERLGTIGEPAFVQRLTKTLEDPRSYEKELYREDALTGIRAAETARDREIALRNQLATEEKPAVAEDTERDLLAAWVKRPDVQWWAKQNGLHLGTTKELTPQMQADIDAGKFPGSIHTKYGVYIPGPDDIQASHFALGQLDRDPNKDLFRAAGLGRGGGGGAPDTLVEVTVGADPALYKDPATGKFYKDPATGKYVKAADVLTRAADEATGEPVGLVAVDAPPPTQVYSGVRKRARYGDVEGSVRWVNPETHKEEYVTPDILRNVVEPGLRSDASKTTLADVVRGATTGGVAKRAGLENDGSADHNDVPGEKPDARKSFFRQYPGTTKGSSVQARREQVDAIRKNLPDVPYTATDEGLNPQRSSTAFVEEHAQRAKASDTATASPVVTDRRQQPGMSPPALVQDFARRQESLLQRPVNGVDPLYDSRYNPPSSTEKDAPTLNVRTREEKEADTVAAQGARTAMSSTTVPATTTPTAGTSDPRKALFKKRFPGDRGTGVETTPEP